MKRIAQCLGLVACISGVAGIDLRAAAPLAGIAPPSGADLYKIHCAACHGLNGTGSGLMTPQLRHVPPDLTQLSRKNGGMFPRARVRRIIEGRDVASHGEREMPVWGDVFMRAGATSQESTDARINAILDYLDSIQLRPSH